MEMDGRAVRLDLQHRAERLVMQVIFAIGVSMMALAVLVHLPRCDWRASASP